MKKKKKLCRITFTTNKSFSFNAFFIFLIFISLSLFIIFIEKEKFLQSIIFIMIFVNSFFFLFNNKIVLEKYFIRIYFGIFVYKIKYKDIKCLYKINNHLISFASSSRRVGIKTNNYKYKLFDVFVSPVDCDDFIYEVDERIN